MRLFAIGDVHGCFTAFDTLLRAIRLRPQDKLVTLGDYINKGPDTKQVLDWLLRLHQAGQLIPLKGNHELKLIEAGNRHQTYNGETTLVDGATLASYSRKNQPGQLADIPASHWNFVQNSCLDWWETEGHIFVHATVEPDKPMMQQSAKALFWDKFRDPPPHCSGKTLVCGHTPQTSGHPANIGHAVCLDTWACGEGWLSCLEIYSGELWQANQRGELRKSHIRTCLQSMSPVKA